MGDNRLAPMLSRTQSSRVFRVRPREKSAVNVQCNRITRAVKTIGDGDYPAPIALLLLRLFLFRTGMFLNITVTFLYLLRCTFFRLCFQILWFFTFVFCIAHNTLTKALLLISHFTKRYAGNKIYLFFSPPPRYTTTGPNAGLRYQQRCR